MRSSQTRSSAQCAPKTSHVTRTLSSVMTVIIVSGQCRNGWMRNLRWTSPRSSSRFCIVLIVGVDGLMWPMLLMFISAALVATTVAFGYRSRMWTSDPLWSGSVWFRTM